MKTITSDLEFYCYLKANLPIGYSIVSEPSGEYYSEQQFSYKVYKNTDLLWTISGDFTTMQSGSLVCRAQSILNETGSKYDHWK